MKISDIAADITVPILKVGMKKMATVISENFIPVHSPIPNADPTQTKRLHEIKL
jgi:hypothetical protein